MTKNTFVRYVEVITLQDAAYAAMRAIKDKRSDKYLARLEEYLKLSYEAERIKINFILDKEPNN